MKAKAKQLRKNSTQAETWLWRQLRNRQLAGCKFRRQHAIGPYIVDFVCLEKQLVIELDGGQHQDQSSYDEQRTRYLNSLGFQVLRF